jgi:glucose-6-phosphate-specific signal transduction histidine kinase
MLDLDAHEESDVLEHIQTAQEWKGSFHQLRGLAARLQSVREEARKKVAREIHNELGQALTAIKMEVSSLLLELGRASRNLSGDRLYDRVGGSNDSVGA